MPNDPILWSREDHTAAKHELLLGFFQKWVSVHSETFAKDARGGLVRIYDGFAGPGIYEGGEPGSPLILLKALATNPNLATRWKQVRFELNFVEKHPGRATRLRSELNNLRSEVTANSSSPLQVSWTVTTGLYEENVPAAVPGRSALFLFLDPFGYSHAPMGLTQDLVQQPKSDTLIFAPFSFVNRFIGREGQEEAMDRFFGADAWREISDGQQRPALLLSLFEDQLRAAGMKWTGSFRLKPDPTNAYFIVGGSGDLQGWESIKQGFWAVDKVHGRDFTARKQDHHADRLFDDGDLGPEKPDTEGLERLLRAEFGTSWFSVEDAIDATARSRFLKTHLKRATLAPAEAAGRLEVDRPPGALQLKEGKGTRLRFV